MQKKIDDIFKMKENEIRELVENSLSITEVEAVIDSIKSCDKVIDEKLELDEIKYKENDIQEQVTELKRQLDFSRRTLASDQELTDLSLQIDTLMAKLNDLNNEKLAIMEKYANIRNNIINICLETIRNAKDIKLELSRQELLDRYTVDLQVLIKKKKGLEITYFNLSKTNNYRDNKVKVRNLKNKIKQIEKEVGQGILEMSIDITNEVVRYRNMIHELSLTDDSTTKYINKVNKELGYTNTKISEIKSIIESLENMSLNDYRNKLLNELSPSLIEQNYLNQSQVYESLLYPVKLQDNRYSNELLDEFKNILSSIKKPVINISNDSNIIDLENSINLADVDIHVNNIENLIKILKNALGVYKKGFLTKYIKSNVIEANLFSVPFDRSKWESYFNIVLEEKDINFLNLINSKYLSIKQRFTLSKSNQNLINNYEEIILNLLEELYYKLLSNYILDSNQYNVTLVDYNELDNYELYIDSTKKYLEERIEALKSLLKELKEEKEVKFKEINEEYERLNNIKEELKNSFDKKQENKNKDIDEISPANELDNNNLDNKTTPEETTNKEDEVDLDVPLISFDVDNSKDNEESIDNTTNESIINDIQKTDLDNSSSIETDNKSEAEDKTLEIPVEPITLSQTNTPEDNDGNGSNESSIFTDKLDSLLNSDKKEDLKESKSNQEEEISITPFNIDNNINDDKSEKITEKKEINNSEDSSLDKKNHSDIDDLLIKDNPIIRDFFKPVFNNNSDNSNNN